MTRRSRFYIPRRLHQLYAWALGYFWLPCPLCRRPFGGHEWRDIDGQVSSVPRPAAPGTSWAICPRCTAVGRGRRPIYIYDEPLED